MRVLVVEDQAELRRMLEQALREAGYAVDVAADGEDGLFKAISWDYDAIVLDLMLPKLDGTELLRRLRREKKTPVLILTARDTLEDRVCRLDDGADDYLVKPFQHAELLARLRALIRRTSGQTTSRLEIGEFVIDLATRTVSRAGQTINLTPMEYSLLEFLALNRGKLVTRDMLYDHLYDEHGDTLSNLIDVLVSKLRRKLGHHIVVTRRGQGYLMDV
jgi:two-component system OmpR family response regulator